MVPTDLYYQYDAAGQMTRVADTAAGVTKTFSWDHLGRMTHAEVNNGGVTKSVDYANNPAGKRFMRVADGVTKAWTYQGDNIASVESTTSPTLHSVYSGSGLGGVAERDDVDTAGGGSTTSRFYLYNHRGDVVGVCDASGNLTSAYDYDAYGAVSQSVQSGGGSAPQGDILFTGKDLDPDTGLYYFNARWYDSESGRFVSRTGLSPDREGPYEFCNSTPVECVDVDGHEGTILGKIWNLPNTVIGGALGTVGSLPAMVYSPFSSKVDFPVSFEHNAVVFHDNILVPPFAAAWTLGNTVFVSPGVPSYACEDILEHEEQHTLQGEDLGPFYIPQYLHSSLFALVGYGDPVGPSNEMETDPYGDPPTPWGY